jgi:hypothetical protein
MSEQSNRCVSLQDISNQMGNNPWTYCLAPSVLRNAHTWDRKAKYRLTPKTSDIASENSTPRISVPTSRTKPPLNLTYGCTNNPAISSLPMPSKSRLSAVRIRHVAQTSLVPACLFKHYPIKHLLIFRASSCCELDSKFWPAGFPCRISCSFRNVWLQLRRAELRDVLCRNRLVPYLDILGCGYTTYCLDMT